MTAELLREAAALMRERAEATTPGPWFLYDGEPWSGDAQVAVEYDAHRITDYEFDSAANPPMSLFQGDVVLKADAVHIASWHPAVALAVAALLEDYAERVESAFAPEVFVELDGGARRALAVARTYLGRAE